MKESVNRLWNWRRYGNGNVYWDNTIIVGVYTENIHEGSEIIYFEENFQPNSAVFIYLLKQKEYKTKKNKIQKSIFI